MIAPTLPGDLPGLLRRGSPVQYPPLMAGSWVVVDVLGETAAIACLAAETPHHHGECHISDLALDLSDPTGRTHAAWWWAERVPVDAAGLPRDRDAYAAMMCARRGGDMDPDEIDTLRRACLAVAGRA